MSLTGLWYVCERRSAGRSHARHGDRAVNSGTTAYGPRIVVCLWMCVGRARACVLRRGQRHSRGLLPVLEDINALLAQGILTHAEFAGTIVPRSHATAAATATGHRHPQL